MNPPASCADHLEVRICLISNHLRQTSVRAPRHSTLYKASFLHREHRYHHLSLLLRP